MYNLARLNAGKALLPFPIPMDKIWLNIKKIIDVFHLRHHTSESCRRQFSPETVKEYYPNAVHFVPDISTRLGIGKATETKMSSWV